MDKCENEVQGIRWGWHPRDHCSPHIRVPAHWPGPGSTALHAATGRLVHHATCPHPLSVPFSNLGRPGLGAAKLRFGRAEAGCAGGVSLPCWHELSYRAKASLVQLARSGRSK